MGLLELSVVFKVNETPNNTCGTIGPFTGILYSKFVPIAIRDEVVALPTILIESLS